MNGKFITLIIINFSITNSAYSNTIKPIENLNHYEQYKIVLQSACNEYSDEKYRECMAQTYRILMNEFPFGNPRFLPRRIRALEDFEENVD